MTQPDAEFQQALESSSLGSAGARSLRGKTSPEDAAKVRELGHLREAVLSGRGNAQSCTELILLYVRHGYEADLIAVWRHMTRNLGRFRYLPEVVSALARDLLVRLFEVTASSAIVDLTAPMPTEAQLDLLSSMREDAAAVLLLGMPPERHRRLLRAGLDRESLSATDLARWFKAASPRTIAAVLVDYLGRGYGQRWHEDRRVRDILDLLPKRPVGRIVDEICKTNIALALKVFNMPRNRSAVTYAIQHETAVDLLIEACEQGDRYSAGWLPERVALDLDRTGVARAREEMQAIALRSPRAAAALRRLLSAALQQGL